MTLRKLIATIVLSLLAMTLWAVPYQFTRINTSNSNISYDGINKITQDSRGFIWIGTFNGLNRYDGTTFKVYDRNALGLSSDFIFCITEDHDGNIWVGTDNGASKYDYLKDTFVPMDLVSDKGTTIRNKVTFIFVDEEGTVWMLVNDQGVFRYDPSTEKLTMRAYNSFGDNILGFRKMLRLKDGSFIMSCYHLNLFTADSNMDNFTPLALGDEKVSFLGDEIEGLFQANDETIYVASSRNGISAVDLSTGRVRSLFKVPEGHTLNDATLDDESRIWLATTRGLWMYDTRTCESLFMDEEPNDRFTISGSYISCAYVDKDNGLWVGTKDGGVNYCGAYQNNFEKCYRTSDGTLLSGAIISGFCEGSDGRLWVSTEQKGLLEYDIKGHKLRQVGNPRIPVTTVSPCYDEPYLWFGTLNGLLRMDTRTGTIKDYGILKRTSGVNDPRVYLVYKTHDGELIAGTTLGIFIYDRATDKFREVSAFDGTFVTGATEDADGRLWFSTYAKGIYMWDYRSGAIPVHYSASSGCGLTTNKITSLFADSSNHLWALGFGHGFSRFVGDKEQFVNFSKTTLPALPSDVYHRMIEDANGQLWLASDSGLVQFNPETNEVKVYSQLDGLLDQKFTNSAYKIRNGDIFFGSDNGFIRFNPTSLYSGQDIPDVVLTSIDINGNETYTGGNIDLMKKLRLEKNQNSFSIHYSIMGIRLPASIRLQCMLEGYDEEWRDLISSTSVDYFNVPAGHYPLIIRGSSDQGEWKDAHTPFAIVIAPGFWESGWGITTCLLILCSIIATTAFIFDQRDKKKRSKQEAEYRRQKDEEMLQEKMDFFSHVIHEIKTPLTLIKTPLSNVMAKEGLDSEVRHDLKVMQNSTSYLARLVNELLDFVRIEKKGYTMHPEPLDMVERLRSLVFDYSDTARNKNIKLNYTPDVARATVQADLSAMDKILNNLLINAINYAESEIDIVLSVSASNLTITFSNDGQAIATDMREEIFKPFVQYRDSRKDTSRGVGIGLPLARNLARMHSGDLFLAPVSDTTCFVLTLPIDQVENIVEATEDSTNQDSDLPKLLIADDNKDLRDYLASKLSEQYSVVTASNGDTAQQMLKEQNIDFLITDISMPGKTGLELCRELREDIEISHLPVIVLSARASVESKIQAMEAGADLYIEKPFDLDYLKSSIKNILDRRMLMKNAFSRGITTADIDMFGLPKKDEEFFTNLDSLIKENLSNTELSVDWLAENLNMSPSTLTRKIRKLLNTTPNNYIRTARLTVAAEMLKNSHGNNISDICYAVGFSNLSYFAKCFKEQYGKIPSEFAAEQ